LVIAEEEEERYTDAAADLLAGAVAGASCHAG